MKLRIFKTLKTVFEEVTVHILKASIQNVEYCFIVYKLMTQITDMNFDKTLIISFAELKNPLMTYHMTSTSWKELTKTCFQTAV